MYLKIALSIIIGYLFGSLNGSLIIGKVFYKKDIRKHGSGNAGTTNTLRILGKNAAIAVIVIDILKGIIACVIGGLLVGNIETFGYIGMYFAGLAAVIGHNWPIFFSFKGGKGVLTTFTVMLYISPIPALICLGIFIIVVAFTRYVSLGSIVAAAFWPLISFIFNLPITLIILGIFMVALIIVRHKENIVRLINRTEKKLSFKKTI
ncbi:MAG: glycerol-3-phosphate 1-O-acyltransferase PlsY [Clostridiaceae bacterium]|jgi:glycerol-3-phosphate acyltransferase PlsY|nr:glycerol-3-phosphate 1-O-acyltransferase PlsY [Clostridiaceae bacterium]